MKKILLSTALISTLISTNLQAGNEWEQFLEAAGFSNTIIDDGSLVSGELYGAKITYKITNNDGISGNFDGSDSVVITVTDKNGKVISTGSALNEDGLKIWAKANANQLLTSILGKNPATTIAGLGEGTLVTSLIVENISSMNLSNSKTGSFEFKADISDIKDAALGVTSSKAILTWAKKRSNDDDYGLMMIYKNTSKDDRYDSKTQNLTLVPFYKLNYHITDNFRVDTVLNAVMGITYLESNMFEDGAGYLEYGGGLAISPKYQVNKDLLLYGNLAYQYVKKNVPTSLVPSDIEYLADALNDLDSNNNIAYGVGSTYSFTNNWNGTLDILQVNNSVEESGKDTATYYRADTSYRIENWAFKAGYKTTKGLDDYEEKSYIASAKYIW